MQLFVEQTLNGLQLGFTLLMVSAGLTLIFGIMNIINLAHGSLFMVGAFVAADVGGRTGNYAVALLAGTAAAAVVGMFVEFVLIRRLYLRDHLDQVLATFALVLMANEAVQMIWGTRPGGVSTPAFLDRTVTVFPGLPYPAYRLAIIAAGIAAISSLYLLVDRTRIGMWIRAGTTHRELLGAFGVNVRLLYTLVFAIGAGLAGFAGVVASPFLSVESGVGDNFLILSFVVIVVGGIGSLKGAVYGSLLLGLVDTWARTYLPLGFDGFLDASTAATVGASVASASIYVVMIVVLVVKPNGLFGLPDG
ncbi:MAG: branched-chain amino acid ABC transporter permease [Acidimicrobiaceae bacterium]|nr:branched-chain amino acid ABC transporter permease [Acidimicrobiaceae bacterium]MXZ99906.1 branched-chain amino acid ABC transporter permease [Acidimicrobiaceae bacterium]MYE75087.1 branched-chain amino acid ABC transporter permease [Acidimicrobiaceae bacterium]MYE98578.1 branched-chain amino acid ABC transporter permease [Acidimicrobiaceae bacterium]MYH43486.1 branched-chain amino acid ABC transporter permease [Acidimicrobiaceae bacterium]